MRRIPLARSISFFIAIVCLAGAMALHADQLAQIEGVVRDPSGAPLAGATVMLKAQGGEWSATTGAQGRFAITAVTATSGTLTVTAPGFSRADLAWEADRNVEITLSVARAEQRMTVNATAETQQPNVAMLDRETLGTSGAMTLEGTLREIPGFKLFRRTPGWSTNGTTQGVSLRGVGANAASRALVLQDGIPAGDPYGGWVYWGQFVSAATNRVEVVQGSQSDLFGSEAMGGVINVIRQNPMQSRFTVDTTYGSSYTPVGSAMGAVRLGGWNLTGGAEGFRTNGYLPLPASERGAVDTVLNSEHRTGDLLLERLFSGSARAFLGGTYYAESRQNGTILQTNSADLRQLRTGVDFNPKGLGSFNVRLFGGSESLWQTFSSVSADRNSEVLTRYQTVPVSQLGSSVFWSRTVGSRQRLLAGMDTQWVSGDDLELAYTAGTPSSNLNNGGSQRTVGVYGEDRIRVTSKLMLSLGARVDHWANLDGHQLVTPIAASAKASATFFADRADTAFSPRAAAQYAIRSRLMAFASAGSSFRAPTLDELYRGFRVGNVVTNANPSLTAERLHGGEIGLSSKISDRVTVRGSYFYDLIDNPVSNVTLSTTPSLITRQRENLGSTRSQGVDASARMKITNSVTLETSYQYADSIVLTFPANAALIGNDVPEVPRHTGTAQLRYSNPKTFTFAMQGRYVGRQFDDDQNLLPLGGFFTADAYLSRQIRRGAELYAAAENLTGRRYEVQRTPIAQLGPPIMARAGLRLTFGHE